ncbi:MAG: amidohydrolase [Acidobacteriota bacterium]
MKTLSHLLLSVSLILALGACRTTTSPTDAAATMMQNPNTFLLFGGTIVTEGPEGTLHDMAIVISHGRIDEILPFDEARRTYPTLPVIDASRYTILPGLIDAHAHVESLGTAMDTVSLDGTQSYDEVIERITSRAATTAKDDWVLGWGWDQNDWTVASFPTAGPLDHAVSDHPVWVSRVDGHAGLANTMAMRLAGVTRDTKDPEGGRILRDSSGNPTGVFVDAAQELIDRVVPSPSHEVRKQRILRAALKIAASGLTGVHDAGIDGEAIRIYQELIDEGEFPIRVYAMLSDNDALLKEWFSRGSLLGYKDQLTVRTVKLYADGALGSRGAALLAPYSDDPTNTGLLVSTAEHLADVATRARAAGFQVATHAIGDRGVRNVIDAYEKAGVTPENRFRIEHLQVVALDDLPRIGRAGIIGSMQPTHATSDMPWAEARIGPQRILGAYAWRKVLNAGSRLALGSDFPVEDVNPWFGIYAAVTRQDQRGSPAGGWYPAEKLTLTEALRGFTIDAAYAAFQESSRGSIEHGKLADFTVVDQDPFSVDPSTLFKTTVRYTIVGGRIVYNAEPTR